MRSLLVALTVCAVFLAYCSSENDDSVPANIHAMVDVWEGLIRNQNAEGLAARYTEDCVYLHQKKGILNGGDAVKQAYEQWFADGTADADVIVLRTEKLGDDYLAVLSKIDIRDNTGQKNAMAVLKKVEEGYGYQTFLEAETTSEK